MRFLTNILAKAGLIVDGTTQLNTIANATVDTDKFLVSDGGVVKYRTAPQLVADLGPLPSSVLRHQVKLGEAINKGQAVYVSSADGTNMIVSKASNVTDLTSSKTLGLIETSGVTNDQVNVVTEGLLAGLDTSTATAGDPVWLGTNGNLIFGLVNKPSAPAHLVFIGVVTRVQSVNGEIFVKVQNGFEMEELHNVAISSIANKNLLMYEAATSLWKNKTLGNVIGGTSTQYVKGDGTLGSFPDIGGGGGLVYYLNGSVSASVGGYFQMSKTPVIGAGTDFSKTGDGLICQFLTDVNDPSLLSVPSGAWRFGLYASMGSAGNSSKFYVEVFKYDGTTFTLIGSSSGTPESVSNGTAIEYYTTTVAMSTTALTVTDRIAVRVYATDNNTRTMTIHTENSHLCDISTTFPSGIASINGLITPSQYLSTTTTGTDFTISSSSNTHYFNLPVASATITGKLSSTDWSTFNNKQNALGYTPVNQTRSLTINGVTYDLSSDRTWSVGTVTSVGLSVPTGFSVSNTPVTGSGTIGLSFTAGYSLPTTASQSNWDVAYTNRITSLTTTGTSGAATLVSNVLNIPQYQAQGSYITSLTGEATASGPGSASVTLSTSAVTGKVLTGLNVTGGTVLATDSILTAFGKLQNQVNGLAGGVTYQGAWDASTNSPSLTSSVGTKGYYYVVSVAGSTNLNGITDWKLGDWAIFNGTAWEKVDNTDAVVSVNGFTGAVSLTTTNIAEGTNLYYTDTRARAAISLTTTGTSGAATYSAGVLNIPQYSLAGLGGVPSNRTLTINGTSYDLSADRTWTITNISGNSATTSAVSGTTNYIPKFTSSSAIGNSAVYDASGSIGIGTSSPVANTPLTLQAASGYTDILWLKSAGTNIDARINMAPTGTGLAQLNNTNGTGIAFQISGSEQMRLTSTGLGIGTSPTQKLHVFGTSGATTAIIEGATNASAYGKLELRGRPAGAGQSTGWIVAASTEGGQAATNVAGIDFTMAGAAGNAHNIQISTHNGTSLTEKMRIGSTGTVRLLSYTTNGFVKFSNSDGTLTVDTNTYLTAESDTLATVTGRGASTSSALTLNGSVTLTSAYTGGSGDWTGVSTPILKIAPISGYWRIPHLSNNATVSGVYNYETNKDVYWGEPTDSGNYYFRGRVLKHENSLGQISTYLHSNNYNSYAPTLTGGGASGTWGISITGSAGSASSVPWTGVSAGTRTNYTLRFQPLASDYAGFEFNTSSGGGGGYFLIRGTSDSDVYTAEGITLVADAGWLTLAQRTASSKGVRIMTGTTSAVRASFATDGSINFTGDPVASGSFRAPYFYDSSNTSYYGRFSGTSRMYGAQFDYVGIGQGINTSYSLITNGSIYLNSNSNGWAEGTWKQRRGGATFYDVIDTGNYNSYSPTLTGGGASGTWGISITGTAAGETLATVTGRGASTSTAVTFNGNVNVGTSASLLFGSQTRQMINLWGTQYGIGVQSNTSYFRSDGRFSWFRGGTHNDAQNNPGGGTVAMTLDGSSNLIVTTSVQAPIFYDSANTSYYLDPNSTTSIRTVGSWRADSSAWDGEFNGKIQYHSNHWYIQGADLFIYRNSGGSNVFTVNQGGTATATGDMRAPIFYDSADTTYFADLASTNTSIYTAGIIRSSGVQVKGSSTGGQIYPTMSNGGVSLYGGNSFTNGAYFTVTGIDYASSPGAGSAEFVIRNTATSKFALFSYNGSTWTGRYGLFGSTGNVTIGDANTDIGYRLYVIGDIYATGNIIANSDARIKTNIREIENPLARVLNTKGVIYDRIDIEENNSIGFIAQELEKEFPELVSTSTDGRKGVKYQNMVAVLVEAIKEQQKQIDILQSLINK
jgi:hypothetical protein